MKNLNKSIGDQLGYGYYRKVKDFSQMFLGHCSNYLDMHAHKPIAIGGVTVLYPAPIFLGQ